VALQVIHHAILAVRGEGHVGVIVRLDELDRDLGTGGHGANHACGCQQGRQGGNVCAFHMRPFGSVRGKFHPTLFRNY
jgi:hypothetical protein